MDIRERVKKVLEREDVQDYLGRRTGVCDICRGLVPLNDDARALLILGNTISGERGWENLKKFSADSHHLAERGIGTTGERRCLGSVPFREKWLSPESEQYGPELAEFVILIRGVGIVNQNGRWVLGDTIPDSQK